jgi:hypothetical protein
MSHETGSTGGRNAALMDAYTDAGGNVNPSAWGVELGVLAPFTEAGANGLDGRFHANDAANILWED